MSDIVKYQQQGATAVLTLSRPDSMNAFTRELRADLQAAIEQAAGDESVRVVILTGEGRCFSAGADLTDNIDRSVTENSVARISAGAGSDRYDSQTGDRCGPGVCGRNRIVHGVAVRPSGHG